MRSLAFLSFIFAALTGSAVVSHALATTEAQCFFPGQNSDFKIQQQAPPPLKSGQRAYVHYPATSVASASISQLNLSTADLPQHFSQWGNHARRRIQKGNLGPGIPHDGSVTINFSSHRTADTCTLAQTATVLGLTDEARILAARSGLKLVTNPAPGNYTNRCPVSVELLKPSITGILLDFEVQDGRTPNETLRFLTRYADLVHRAGKRVILYTNALDAPSQHLTGINGNNARRLMKAYDLISLLLWGGNKQHNFAASFNAQLRMLGNADPEKVLLVFDLNTSRLADAATVRRLAKRHAIQNISLWRNNSIQGGRCSTAVNIKIACLAFGSCSNSQKP